MWIIPVTNKESIALIIIINQYVQNIWINLIKIKRNHAVNLIIIMKEKIVTVSKNIGRIDYDLNNMIMNKICIKRTKITTLQII